MHQMPGIQSQLGYPDSAFTWWRTHHPLEALYRWIVGFRSSALVPMGVFFWTCFFHLHWWIEIDTLVVGRCKLNAENPAGQSSGRSFSAQWIQYHNHGLNGTGPWFLTIVVTGIQWVCPQNSKPLNIKVITYKSHDCCEGNPGFWWFWGPWYIYIYIYTCVIIYFKYL